MLPTGRKRWMAHVFDPDVVHDCALACLDKPKPAMFDAFAAAMEGRYPDRLDLDQPWIFSNAGGAMIQMKLYYASIFEYVMIWGTPSARRATRDGTRSVSGTPSSTA